MSFAEQSQETMPTNADIFLQSLEEQGIDYLFTVLGSDHPSLLESYHKRLLLKKTTPEMLIFNHEFIAISAADAYARMTGNAQCVIVHVDVGTAALGQGLHNASSGKVPLIIFAGKAPTTVREAKGCRSEHVHWYQDIRNQELLVQPYSRYSREFVVGDDVRGVVGRAALMAMTGNRGPVYLTATREVLAAKATDAGASLISSKSRFYPGELSDEHAQLVGKALLEAKNPLVITGYLGRNHRAVNALVRLADAVKTLQIMDSEAREMSFPANHPAWRTRRTGAPQAIRTADVVLVLDADVPWIPSKFSPSESARIFHIDCDVRKENMMLFDIGAEASWNVECDTALEKICEYIAKHGGERLTSSDYETAERERKKRHTEGLETLNNLAAERADGKISADMLFATLRKELPNDTVFANDVVTNQVTLLEQLQLSKPGTFLTKGGSGLGWSLGASIGVKLACRLYDLSSRPAIQRKKTPDDGEFICCVTGDGAFWFSNPGAAFLDAGGLETPFLTVVVNNGGWTATRACVDDVHPDGVAKKSERLFGNHLQRVRPSYVGIAMAATGDGMWGARVERAEDLVPAIRKAVEFMGTENRGAILEVVVS